MRPKWQKLADLTQKTDTSAFSHSCVHIHALKSHSLWNLFLLSPLFGFFCEDMNKTGGVILVTRSNTGQFQNNVLMVRESICHSDHLLLISEEYFSSLILCRIFFMILYKYIGPSLGARTNNPSCTKFCWWQQTLSVWSFVVNLNQMITLITDSIQNFPQFYTCILALEQGRQHLWTKCHRKRKAFVYPIIFVNLRRMA